MDARAGDGHQLERSDRRLDAGVRESAMFHVNFLGSKHCSVARGGHVGSILRPEQVPDRTSVHATKPWGALDVVTRPCSTALGRRSGLPSTRAARSPFRRIWATWTSVRKLKEGSVSADLLGS